ncbi:hypothetical protein COOONC_24342 [Cooperia oncophora]
MQKKSIIHPHFSGPVALDSRSTWAPRVLACVAISVAAYNVVQFGELQARECLLADNYTIYELCPTELRLSEVYVVVYKGYMYTLSMAFIPFILLTILTFGIVYLLRMKHVKSEKVICECKFFFSSSLFLLFCLLL